MPVVGHQAPGKDADRRALVGQGQHLLEGEVVLILFEQPQFSVGRIEHVICQPAGGASCHSGHGPYLKAAEDKSKGVRHLQF